MSRKWAAVPAIMVVLLTTVLAVFALDRIDSGARRAAEYLGYDGPVVDIIAIEGDTGAPANDFSSQVRRYANAKGLSVAYTRWYDSGIVTLEDPEGRFTSSEGPLIDAIGRSGEGSSIAVARNVEDISTALASTLGQHGRVASFMSDVKFQGHYPIVIAGPKANPFGTGAYTFSGPSNVEQPDVESLVSLFTQGGLAVVNVSISNGADPWTIVREAVGSIYGAIFVLFVLMLATSIGIVSWYFVHLRRKRLTVAALLGARATDLFRMCMKDLVSAVSAGLVAGLTVGIFVVVVSQGATTAASSARFAAVLLACGLSTVLAMSAGACAAGLESRRFR